MIKTLAHYEITSQLGKGGMGEVYKARDQKLGRDVAVKVLPEEFARDADRIARFQREAKLLASINHPNIAAIYGLEESDKTHFLVMELVEGQTLAERIKTGPIPLEEALKFAFQIMEALEAAHEKGVIHRDLKPENIKITHDKKVKVLDFGLAKQAAAHGVIESREETLSEVTQSGAIIGTLAYMSPEQLQAKAADARSDLFSFGIVLYEMLTGIHPFKRPSSMETASAILTATPPPIDPKSTKIPGPLQEITGKLLAKDPARRYQSANEVHSALGEMVTASQSLKVWSVTRRTFRRYAFFAAAIILALILALIFRDQLPRWAGGKALPKQICLAVLPFNNVGSDPETQVICDGLMEILSTKFNQMQQFQDALDIVSTTEVRTENIQSPSHARRAFGANIVLTGSVQKILEKILLTINLVDTETLRQLGGEMYTAGVGELLKLEEDAVTGASSMLQLKLNAMSRQALSAGETRIPSAYNSYLQAIGYLARYDKPENIENSIHLFQQAINKDSNYALAFAGLGEAYWRKYRYTSEQRWADLALLNCLHAAEINQQLARVHVTLGMIYTGTGNPGKALEELKHAISLEPRNAEAYRELGRSCEALGKLGEAEETYRKAIQLKPDSWSCYWNLGSFYYRRSRYNDAARQFQEVIRLAPDHYRAYSSLGGIYIFEGDFEKAAKMFRISLDIKPSPQAYSNLAASFILQERFAEAASMLEKAVAMGNPSYEIWGNLADAYSESQQMKSKAAGAYEKALELAGKAVAVNPRSRARADMALYLTRLGKRKQALDEINQARELLPEDQNVLFLTTIVYELTGNREKALHTLSAAVASGYSLAIIRAVSDLKELRKDPRYREMVEGQAQLNSKP
jgi:tetratricopeptide (TPR) repeat protein/tRNA A-37 threonylcarbamoyl transferase component Bud32